MSMLFKRIKDWETSITAFRTGDVIPVDGPSGTAKMSKDDLLKETAENENLIRSKGYIYNDATAISAFGDSKSVDNANVNTIYEIVASYVTGLPTGAGNGQLITYMGVDAGGIANVQIYVDSVDYAPNMYVRKKLAGRFTGWKKVAFDDGSLIHTKSFLSTEAKVIAEFGASKDVVNAKVNTIYALDTRLCVGLPDADTHTGGDLFTYCGDSTIDTNVQLFVTNHGATYFRIKWGSAAYTDWKNVAYEDGTLIRSKGYIYNDATAISAFGDSKSVDNAKNNTIYEIVASYVTGLPKGAGNGQLMTYMGVDYGGIANVQIYVDSVDYVPNMYVRKKLAGRFTEWKSLSRGVSHIIPQFLKIGFVGDSVSSGASEYKDSDNNYHCIDNPEYSQVQCWGRERGVTALNLSQGGMTTRNWFTREKGYTRATTPGNECKCYFIMLGGNDIGEYHDLQDIGSTADVHVGNENLNADTYYGNYSKIIATLKSAGGRFTKIFAFTYPTIVNSSPYLVDYNAATREICALYDDVYVIELENDPVINGNQVRAEKYRGHFSAHGYKLMADRMEYLVDMYVEEHGSNFENIQFIGTNLDVQEWMS